MTRTRAEIHSLIDEIFDLKEKLLDQANSDAEFVASAIFDDEKVNTIDYFIAQNRQVESDMFLLRDKIYQFWQKDCHEPGNIYHRYFIKLRDSMSNKYYGNGVFLYPNQK